MPIGDELANLGKVRNVLDEDWHDVGISTKPVPESETETYPVPVFANIAAFE